MFLQERNKTAYAIERYQKFPAIWNAADPGILRLKMPRKGRLDI